MHRGRTQRPRGGLDREAVTGASRGRKLRPVRFRALRGQYTTCRCGSAPTTAISTPIRGPAGKSRSVDGHRRRRSRHHCRRENCSATRRSRADHKYDGLDLQRAGLAVTAAEIESAFAACSKETLDALYFARDRIADHHKRQLPPMTATAMRPASNSVIDGLRSNWLGFMYPAVWRPIQARF